MLRSLHAMIYLAIRLYICWTNCQLQDKNGDQIEGILYYLQFLYWTQAQSNYVQGLDGVRSNQYTILCRAHLRGNGW